MKSKKGKILKIIPGINPNCSAALTALVFMIFSIPIHLVINIVANVILFKKSQKEKIKKDIDIFSISESIWRLRYLIFFVAVLWIGTLIFSLLIEMIRTGEIGSWSWIVVALQISCPPISLIISLLIGEKMLHSRKPIWIFIISPLSYLIMIVVLWLLFGSLFALIFSLVDRIVSPL